MAISKCVNMAEISVMTSHGCDGLSRDTWFVKVVMGAMRTKRLCCVFGFHRLDNNCYNVCFKKREPLNLYYISVTEILSVDHIELNAA